VICQNTRRHIPDDSHFHGIQTQFSIKIRVFLYWIEQIWASVTTLFHYVRRHITTCVLARYSCHIKMSTCDESRTNISEIWRERASNTIDLVRSYEDIKLKTYVSIRNARIHRPAVRGETTTNFQNSQNFSDVVRICLSVYNIISLILPTKVCLQNIVCPKKILWSGVAVSRITQDV